MAQVPEKKNTAVTDTLAPIARQLVQEPVPLTPEQREGKIQEFLTRAVTAVYPSADALGVVLRSGERLSAYMGIDPTAPEMHVGHESQLLKLRRLQELGHRVILLIGDYTAMIGDPTDKSSARVKLAREQVLANAASYKEQASKILDFDDPVNPIEMRYNSEWLAAMNFGDVLELMSQATVQQLLQRDMFQKRMGEGKPLYAHEMVYPLMQGWDSVNIVEGGIDIEIGGSDQIFNMLVGSDLIRREFGKQKFVVGGDLLVDPSGKKIGKTEGNMITLVDTPEIMYEKIMMWGDGIVPHALELCSDLPMEQVNEIARQMESGELDGRSAKQFLARTIVSQLHSPELAQQAEVKYNAVAQGTLAAEELPETQLASGATLVDAVISSGLAASKSAARRLIQQGGVRVDGTPVTDPEAIVVGERLKVGKKQGGERRLVFVEPPQE